MPRFVALLAKRPKCAVKIACVAAEWAEVEHNLAFLYWIVTSRTRKVPITGPSEMYQTDPNPIAEATMDALESLRVRVSVIRSVMAITAPGQMDAFEKLAKRIRATALRRNRVVHGRWRFVENYPEDVILLEGKEKWRYTEADFDQIIQATDRLAVDLMHFSFQCTRAVAKGPLPESSAPAK
jgi:hypothetical protein